MPLRLIIFDCDGVLIDSEPIASRVVAASLTELGWPLSPADSHRMFLGMSLSDMKPLIEMQIGSPLPGDWVVSLADRLVATMAEEAILMDGALEAISGVAALGLDWRIASNSGRPELEAKFARTKITDLVRDRYHSASDVIAVGGRGKPAPDVFLAAAAASGVHPNHCLVIEDSVAGITAAAAAGMDCLAFRAEITIGAAVPLHDLTHLPGLLREAQERWAA